jgi:hypothetical protein
VSIAHKTTSAKSSGSLTGILTDGEELRENINSGTAGLRRNRGIGTTHRQRKSECAAHGGIFS